MSDKRRTNRVRIDLYLNKYIAGVPYLTRAYDISPEGLSLSHLIEPSFKGRRVGLQFQLPGSEEVIYAEGEVVREWVSDRQDGSGVRFTLLTERHRKMINEFISTAQHQGGALN